MVKKHLKRYSALLTIWEVQIKTTKRYHFKIIKMTIIKNVLKKQKINVGKDIKPVEPLRPVGRNSKWCSCYKRKHGSFAKI